LSAVLIEDTTLTAPDGYVPAATVFTPMSTPRRAVLINSATAVPRKIYRGLASYLAEQGCTASRHAVARCGGMAGTLSYSRHTHFWQPHLVCLVQSARKTRLH
jgi:predicted alpha/beta hydrolase